MRSSTTRGPRSMTRRRRPRPGPPPSPSFTTRLADVPIEEVARLPAPGTAVPVSLAFSPSGRRLTYLHSDDGSLDRHLYTLDTETGERTELLDPPGGGVQEEALSLEARLRRERHRELGLGVT